MKKIIIATLLLLAGCKDGTNKPDNGPKNLRGKESTIITCVPVIEGFDFEGHRYIVVYSSTGCGIIHAENCPCLIHKDKEK